MKRMYLTGVALLTLAGAPAISMAQDKVEASIGADLVSGYIWRGQDLGNVSIQHSAFCLRVLQRIYPFRMGFCGNR